ncbi:MAG TPA: peptidoglycan-associated lipoprotein Pal [Caulobacteraceae bacterium]|nr:peptidoglycan-associated lipoprotein Pal [Caulobacteraceae bacterium]
MSFVSKPIVRLALISVAAAALAACASHPKPGPEAPPAPAPLPAPPPQAQAGPPVGRIVPGSVQDFVINVGDRIYFDFNEYGIRADAQPVLAAQASWLNRYGAVQVRIEGNCDERGTREYNLALGARRANSVRDFLVSHGVSPDRITTISYGKERPIDPGTGEEAWAKDRNGHTAIVSGAR